VHPVSRLPLAEAHLRAPDRTGFVVVNAAGKPPHPDVLSARFRRVCREARVPPIRQRAIRHTLAMLLHRAGVAPRDAARMLGHTVQTHLMVYLPGDDAGARAAAATVRQVLAAEG
jgi:integrase